MKTQNYLSIICSILIAIGLKNIILIFDEIPVKAVTGIIMIFIGFVILLFKFHDKEKAHFLKRALGLFVGFLVGCILFEKLVIY